jgi:hypothetical protein
MVLRWNGQPRHPPGELAPFSRHRIVFGDLIRLPKGPTFECTGVIFDSTITTKQILPPALPTPVQGEVKP